MTFKEQKKGFLFWKKYQYDLLLADKNAMFMLQCKKQLTKSDLDILFLKVSHLDALAGSIKTEKGIIKFKLKNFTWLEDDEPAE